MGGANFLVERRHFFLRGWVIFPGAVFEGQFSGGQFSGGGGIFLEPLRHSVRHDWFPGNILLQWLVDSMMCQFCLTSYRYTNEVVINKLFLRPLKRHGDRRETFCCLTNPKRVRKSPNSPLCWHITLTSRELVNKFWPIISHSNPIGEPL